jgi:molybdopterin synthase catalytic subunit
VPIWKKEFYADGAVWLEGPGAAPVAVTTPTA